MVRLIISSLQETDTGRFTLRELPRRPMATSGICRRCANSLELGVGVAVLATCFGVPIAWAISRTDMPAQGASSG